MWWCGVDDGLVAVLSGIGRGPTQDHKDVAGDTFAEEVRAASQLRSGTPDPRSSHMLSAYSYRCVHPFMIISGSHPDRRSV